jgi:hypothetical protein
LSAVPAIVDSLQDARHGRAVSEEFTSFPFWFDVNTLNSTSEPALVDFGGMAATPAL